MPPSADVGKKRKRHTDGSSKPSKRVAIDDSKDIRIRLKEGDEWAPVIATTPGLSLPTSLQLKSYSRARPHPPKNTTDKNTIATKELLLRSEDDSKLQFTGKEEEADEEDAGADSSEPYLKHYVGVYNPETGDLDVMEARSMVVRGIVRAHQPQEKDLIAMNHRQQKNALGQAFGTKKAKKAILAVTENAISTNRASRDQPNTPVKLDPAAAAMLANMAEATSGMATKAELDASMNAAKPRPQANTETSDVTQVYTVDGLIGKEAMAALQVRQWQVDMKASKNVQVTSRYVANRLLKYKDNVEKLKMMRYLLLLLDFYNATIPTRDGRKLKRPDEMKSILSGQPESLLQHVKRKFADGSVMSRHSADLLITHICAIALVVDNYEVDTWDLKEDLKLELNPMTQYFKEVGARVTNMSEAYRKSSGMDKLAASQRRLAKLKVPLEFPTTKFVRSRR